MLRSVVWITLCIQVLAAQGRASPEVDHDAAPSPSPSPSPAPLNASDINCCPSGLIRQKRNTPCVDWPEHKPLQCEDYYRLEPNKYPEDRFRVEDGHLYIGTDDDRDFKKNGEFCVGDFQLDANTTEYIALVCFLPEDSQTDLHSRNLLTGVCLSISVAFLALTLLVYAVLPELRDLDGRVLMSYVASFAVADLVLALLQFHGHHLTVMMCVTQAFCLYFWLLAAFFWMNVVCFNVWRRTINLRLPLSERHLFFVYFCYGFGMPILFLICTIFSEHFPGNHLKPHFGVSKCWFQEPMASWAYFYGPVAVLLGCNMFFFVWSVWALWQNYSHIQTDTRLRSLRCKCCLYLKLAVLMGVTWIFEIISFLVGDMPFFLYVTDVLNSLQGFLIFLLLVATRKRVLRLLAKRRPCGLAPPRRWVQGPDEESEAMLPEEEPAQLGSYAPSLHVSAEACGRGPAA